LLLVKVLLDSAHRIRAWEGLDRRVIAIHGEEGMLWQRFRMTLLASVVMATATVTVRAEEAPPADQKMATTTAAPAQEMRTICVKEWVPEKYETTRIVYRRECHEETVKGFKVVCTPENRPQEIWVSHMVPEVKDGVRTVYHPEWTEEPRTVIKHVVTCKQVTTVTRKCVDMGHWECKEVPCESFLSKCRKMFHNDCCEPCPPPTKTVKVWCPNKVWVETPCTKTVRCVECVPTTCMVKVCKMVPKQEPCKVTTYRCEKEKKIVNCTVMIAKQVPCEYTRTVVKCVPCEEKVTCCRMVCRTVEKQVPIEACSSTPCCPTTCCVKTKRCCH
jgi:hypothetical protein